jgi:anti-anti-sigma regulatory factor
VVCYSIVHGKVGDPRAKVTIHVEGSVLSGDWDTLRTLCNDTLKARRHLVLNIERVDRYDYSFGALVCLLRRTAQLLGKRMTVVGRPDATFTCVYAAVLNSGNKQCSFSAADSSCLWNKLTVKHALS